MIFGQISDRTEGMAKAKSAAYVRKLNNSQVKIYPCRTGTGHEYFTLVYRDAGKRKRETLSDRVKVEARAKDVLQHLDSGRLTALELTRDDVDEYRAAKAEAAETGIPLVQLCRDHKEALKLLDGRPFMEAIRYYVKTHPRDMAPRLIADVADELFAEKRTLGKTEEYVGQLKHQCGKFSKMFSKPIADVTESDAKLFVSSLGKLSPRTKNNVIAGVRELFRFAKKQKYIPKDFDQLDAVEMFEEGDGQILIFTPAEMAEMLKHADPKIVPALAIGAFAGLRRSEVMKLDWSEVSLSRRHITVSSAVAKKTKRGRQRRIVPVVPNLLAWLSPFSKRSGRVIEMEEDRYCELRIEAADAAGFEWRKNALRHSFISYRVAQVKDVAQVSLEAGNSPQVIFSNYRELVTPADAKRWFAIAPKMAEKVVAMKEVSA